LTPIRVIVVEDHRMFAEAVELLLTGEEGIDMIGAVGSGEEALELIRSDQPDVALVDFDLPGIDGIQTTRLIKEMSPATQVVIITAFQEPAIVAGAIEAGASGFIPKTQAAEDLLEVVRKAGAGEMVLPPGDIASVLLKLQQAQASRSEADTLLARLTTREIEILEVIAEGKSTQEVASALHISPLTVQTHVKNILAKLEVHSKLEAVTFALRQGLFRLGRDSSRSARRPTSPKASGSNVPLDLDPRPFT
jgi:NarL family two-component system response regulator LiaR